MVPWELKEPLGVVHAEGDEFQWLQDSVIRRILFLTSHCYLRDQRLIDIRNYESISWNNYNVWINSIELPEKL